MSAPLTPALRRRPMLGALGALASLAGPGLLSAPARAQSTFPQRPITLVVPFAAGGVADLTARVVGQAMGSVLKQPVVVDNRPGAGGIVATSLVVQAAPDGHTLLLMSNASAVSVHLFKKLPFDVTRQLAPISTLGFFDLGLAVPATSRFKTLADLLAYARAQPGRLTLGSIAPGSTQHLAAELFKSRAGIEATVVPYKGSPALLQALRAGEVDLGFEILSPLLPQVQAQALRLLAVTGAQRFSGLPEVATVKEQGVAQYEVDSWNALAAPAGTPPQALDRLNAAARDALAQPAVQSALLKLGVKPQAGTPAELSQLLNSEIKHWGEVVRRAGITPE